MMMMMMMMMMIIIINQSMPHKPHLEQLILLQRLLLIHEHLLESLAQLNAHDCVLLVHLVLLQHGSSELSIALLEREDLLVALVEVVSELQALSGDEC